MLAALALVALVLAAFVRLLPATLLALVSALLILLALLVLPALLLRAAVLALLALVALLALLALLSLVVLVAIASLAPRGSLVGTKPRRDLQRACQRLAYGETARVARAAV